MGTVVQHQKRRRQPPSGNRFGFEGELRSAAQPPEMQRADLQARLARGNERLVEIRAAKAKLAPVAAAGSRSAREKFAALGSEQAALTTDAEVLTLAIEAMDQQAVDNFDAADAERVERQEKERVESLAVQEAQARENIEAMIRKFEAVGEHNQAGVWRGELDRVRQRLEREYPAPGRLAVPTRIAKR